MSAFHWATSCHVSAPHWSTSAMWAPHPYRPDKWAPPMPHGSQPLVHISSHLIQQLDKWQHAIRPLQQSGAMWPSLIGPPHHCEPHYTIRRLTSGPHWMPHGMHSLAPCHHTVCTKSDRWLFMVGTEQHKVPHGTISQGHIIHRPLILRVCLTKQPTNQAEPPQPININH